MLFFIFWYVLVASGIYLTAIAIISTHPHTIKRKKAKSNMIPIFSIKFTEPRRFISDSGSSSWSSDFASSCSLLSSFFLSFSSHSGSMSLSHFLLDSTPNYSFAHSVNQDVSKNSKNASFLNYSMNIFASGEMLIFQF